MKVTIRDILTIPICKNHATVISGAGLENEVRFLTIMEAPDFHFDTLNDKVMILTTLSSHHDSLEDINNTIEGLCKVPVSAIGIKLGRFVDTIDPSTIEIAKKYNVALLAFDVRVLFKDILGEAYTYIADDQHFMMEQVIRFNRRVVNSIMMGHGLSDILRLYCNEIRSHCFLYDLDLNRIAEAASLQEKIDPDDVEDLIETFKKQNSFLSYPNRNSRYSIFPCRVGKQVSHYLVIALEKEESELSRQLGAVLSDNLSIKLMESAIESKAKDELAASLLNDILFTSHEEEAVIVDRLNLLGFKPFDRHVLIYAMQEKESEQSVQASRLKHIQSTFLNYFDSCTAFVLNEGYFILISHKTGKNAGTPKQDIIKALSSISWMKDLGYTVGVSIPTGDLRNMPISYKQAKSALQYGNLFKPQYSIHFYEDYIEVSLLSYSINSDSGKVIRKRIIEPIQVYDEKYNTEIWHTLEVSLNTETLNEAANELFIHISTLRYRLEKISSLTGYNYFSNKDRLTLHIAYLVAMADRAENN